MQMMLRVVCSLCDFTGCAKQSWQHQRLLP